MSREQTYYNNSIVKRTLFTDIALEYQAKWGYSDKAMVDILARKEPHAKQDRKFAGRSDPGGK
jgi:hypothetical protein